MALLAVIIWQPNQILPRQSIRQSLTVVLMGGKVCEWLSVGMCECYKIRVYKDDKVIVDKTFTAE